VRHKKRRGAQKLSLSFFGRDSADDSDAHVASRFEGPLAKAQIGRSIRDGLNALPRRPFP